MTRPAQDRHPDLQKDVEDHRQTDHKLDLCRRYPRRWASILSVASSQYVDSRHLFLVDGFAGGGLHRSRDHPDGVQLGTALIACFVAREIQRRYHNTVHVRLVECNAAYCATLKRRIEPFVSAVGYDHVDVEIIPGQFADSVLPILKETEPKSRQWHSLWLVDPYGTKEIPHWSLELLDREPRGPEVLINLATNGVFREASLANHGDTGAEERMERLYGGTLWRRAFNAGIPQVDREPYLAALYRDSFRRSQYGVHHLLRRSDGQTRHFIHLAKSPIAAKAFLNDYRASLRYGLFSGTALNEAQKAEYAKELFAAFQGTTATINEMHAAQVTALDKGQLRAVMGSADRGGYGDWDATASVMRWRRVRLVHPQLLLQIDG